MLANTKNTATAASRCHSVALNPRNPGDGDAGVATLPVVTAGAGVAAATRGRAGSGGVPAQDVLDQAQRHAYARTGEAGVPVDALREPAGDERSDGGTEVDSHIEDREPRVTPCVRGVIQRA